MNNGMGFAAAVFVLLAALAVPPLLDSVAGKSHTEYVLEAAEILQDYTETLEDVAPVPPEDRYALGLASGRVVNGVSDIQAFLSLGDYRSADKRLKSMQRDLDDLKAYAGGS